LVLSSHLEEFKQSDEIEQKHLLLTPEVNQLNELTRSHMK